MLGPVRSGLRRRVRGFCLALDQLAGAVPVFLVPALGASFGLPELIGALADTALAFVIRRRKWQVVSHGILRGILEEGSPEEYPAKRLSRNLSRRGLTLMDTQLRSTPGLTRDFCRRSDARRAGPAKVNGFDGSRTNALALAYEIVESATKEIALV
jgi:hypothetical protein